MQRSHQAILPTCAAENNWESRGSGQACDCILKGSIVVKGEGSSRVVVIGDQDGISNGSLSLADGGVESCGGGCAVYLCKVVVNVGEIGSQLFQQNWDLVHPHEVGGAIIGGVSILDVVDEHGCRAGGLAEGVPAGGCNDQACIKQEVPKTETIIARIMKMAMKQRGQVNSEDQYSTPGSFRQQPQGQQYGQQQKQAIQGRQISMSRNPMTKATKNRMNFGEFCISFLAVSAFPLINLSMMSVLNNQKCTH